MAPLLNLLLATQQLLAGPSSNPTHHEPRLGAVASENTICSNIGVDLLRSGGSAADAMVGTVFCVGVIGMYHSGIGGGGFMLVRGADGSYEDIDFRESAPAAASENMYKNNLTASYIGGLSAGVPGEVRGLAYLHKKYGRLPWRDVVLPAVKVARYGWKVSDDLVRYMDAATRRDSFLTTDPNWAMDFAPKGKMVGINDTITRKRYADTLETIANEGPEAFYEGPIAQTMIEALNRTGGIMTLDDLKNYTIVVRKPAMIDYRGYKIASCKAPASGAVALAVMKIVEGYSDFGYASAINLSTHRLDEAMRFGYGMRTKLGDPAFVSGMEEYQDDMLNKTTEKDIRRRISDSKSQNVSFYNPDGVESLDTHGTSHVSVADQDGMAITLTTTINLIFGSKVLVPETGIILNDEMNDFSVPNRSNAFGFIPSPANFIRPGKRPLSSISPAIVETALGALYFVTGAAGGSRIPTATIQSLWHVLDHNMSVHDALAAPRLHDQLMPNNAVFEWAYDNSTVDFMRGRGHNVTWVGPGVSTMHAVRLWENGTFEAAGEPRQRDSGGIAV